MRSIHKEDEHTLAEIFYRAWVVEIQGEPTRTPTIAELERYTSVAEQKLLDVIRQIKIRHIELFSKDMQTNKDCTASSTSSS